MQAESNRPAGVKRITPDGGHFFFGYYDVAAFDASGRYHLYHKVGFMDRQPLAADAAEIGMIDLESGRATRIGETTAWNFQQGAMLQWNPARPDREIIHNVRSGDSCRAVVRDVLTGAERFLPLPVAAIDPAGKRALSINFGRVFGFRPGYGYAGVADPGAGDKAPAEDGVFLVDMAAGTSRLIVSYPQINELLRGAGSVVADGKLVVNHITFNTTGSRFVFLVRNFPSPGQRWGTAMLTASAEGGDFYVLNPYRMTSHYHWRDEGHILAYAEHKEGNRLYLFRDKSPDCEVIAPGFFKADGHCSYSPDRRLILYDSYPVQGHRHLYLYNAAEKRGADLGAFYSDPAAAGDNRCDLHPRWRPDGKMVSFDSTHERQRHIYLFDPEQAHSGIA